MEDGLVLCSPNSRRNKSGVLILVVVEDGLVQKEVFAQVNEELDVLILVVVEDGLVQSKCFCSRQT